MSSFWPDGANAAAAIASAIAAGAAGYTAVRANKISDSANRASDAANRTADAVAQIERDRWHTELTPEFRLAAHRLGPGTNQATLRVELEGPTGLPALQQVIVHIRDDGYSHFLVGEETQEEIDRTIFGPYRFKEGIAGVSPDCRTATGRPLQLGDWDKFWLQRTAPPTWTSREMWDRQYETARMRIVIECHADGHKPWYIPLTLRVSSS